SAVSQGLGGRGCCWSGSCWCGSDCQHDRLPGRVSPGSRSWMSRKIEVSSAHVDAEVLGDTPQPGGVALADRAELPFAEAPVDFAEDHGGLGRGVLRQVVAGDLGVVCLVDDPDERVAHLAKVLLALLGFVNADREHDLAALRGHGAEVNLDLLVVAFAAP